MEFLLRAMKISKIDCSNVAQTKYTKTHQIVYFKRVYCMAGEFYLQVILKNEEMVYIFYIFFLQLRNQRFSGQSSAITLSGLGIFPWLIFSKFLNCFYRLFKRFASLLMSFQQNCNQQNLAIFSSSQICCHELHVVSSHSVLCYLQ